MSTSQCCQPMAFCVPENYGILFPSLVGPMGPPGGPGLYVTSYGELRALDPSEFPAGYVANVGGYATINDGGEGVFTYDPVSTVADNNGTILAPFNSIGRWNRVNSGPVNIKWFGAVGDGATDNYAAIFSALTFALSIDGCLYVPTGVFVVFQEVKFLGLQQKISIKGDGPNVSILMAKAGGFGAGVALNLTFDQDGVAQPWGLVLMDIGFRALGDCHTAFIVSYGDPVATSDHYEPSTIIRNVCIMGGDTGTWLNGCRFSAAWNICMTDVFISGNSAGGVWNNMAGSGIQLEHYCVNSHFVNVHCNFFATGFFYDAGAGGNTEGLFFSNCSMVAVKKGVWITGNASAAAPRVSTFTWTGGMIELRITGVTTGSAAFHLKNVWTALITGCQMITESITSPPTTYGLFLDNCVGVVVTGCDINAWNIGLATFNTCVAINSHGNTYTNCSTQNIFNTGTTGSRSYGHVYYNNTPDDQDPGAVNKLGFID